MRLAIARTGNEASQHFGHCDNFMIYDIEDNKIVNQSILQNPGHVPGALPPFLHEHGVKVVIAGGMGERAREIFTANDIQTITGLNGSVEEVLNAYLSNTLEASNETCDHEGHDH